MSDEHNVEKCILSEERLDCLERRLIEAVRENLREAKGDNAIGEEIKAIIGRAVKCNLKQ